MLLISGALPQAIVLIAGIPFNATLYFFGEAELVRPPAHLRRDAGAARLRIAPADAPAGEALIPARLAPAAPS